MNKEIIPAFATDFDNTLYTKTGFKEEDISTIKKKQEEHLIFGVCTGRSLSGVLVPSKDKIQYDFYIMATGSLILDKNLNVIFSSVIDTQSFKQISLEYGTKYKIAYNLGYDFYSLHNDYEVVKVVSSLDDLPNSIHGISFLTENSNVANGICLEVMKKYPVNAFHNGPFVDITAKDCSKGKAIHLIKNHFSIPTIASIGDSYNDISMLEASDVSFTFPFSPQEVKEKVTHIVSSVSEALEIIY